MQGFERRTQGELYWEKRALRPGNFRKFYRAKFWSD